MTTVVDAGRLATTFPRFRAFVPGATDPRLYALLEHLSRPGLTLSYEWQYLTT